MNPLVTLAFFFALTLHSNAQSNSQPIAPLNRPLPTDSMPSWAKLLYVEPLNMTAVETAYEKFYRIAPFEKNNYTRYYKRLIRATEQFTSADGSVSVPSGVQMMELPTVSDEMYGKGGNPKAQATRWSPIGPMKTIYANTTPATTCPWQVNVYAFDVAKSNPNILYCMTETGGFFKTSDKGLHWTQMEPGVASNGDAVAISPIDANDVYYGVSGGIIRTRDAGTRWSIIPNTPTGSIYDIELADGRNTMLAASSEGLFVTTDGGNVWEKKVAKSCCEIEYLGGATFVALIFDPTAKRYEPWKTIDGGVTWAKKITGWQNSVTSEGAGRMSITPANPDLIVVCLLGKDQPNIIKSTDAGETWTITATGSTTELGMNNGQGFYDLSIAISATDANQIIVGTQTTYRSDDGGRTFTAIGGYQGKFPIHPDLQEVRSIGNDTWIATDGGLTLSNDFFTKTSESRNNGINGADFWGFDGGWSEDVLCGGRYHNGNTAWLGPDANGTGGYDSLFLRMGGGEAATGYVHPIENRRMYFSDIGGYEIGDSATQNVKNFPVGKFPTESYYHMHASNYAWDPHCYRTVWMGSGATIWRSNDDGKTWDSIFTSTDVGASMEKLEIARSNWRVMYCKQRSNDLYDAKIWRTTDAGKTWKATETFPNTTRGERRVMSISVSGANADELWAGLGSGGTTNKVFKSRDGGKTWENLTTQIIANFVIYDIVHQIGTNGGVYISGGKGLVYYRNATMDDWIQLGEGAPLAFESRYLRPFYRDGKLRNGGSLGIWEHPLYEHSKPIARPTVDKLQSSCERDTFFFADFSALEFANQKWQWQFPGAEYVSDLASPRPRVVYSKPGKYFAWLTVSNAYGIDSARFDSITILPSECAIERLAGNSLSLPTTSEQAVLDKLPLLESMTGFTTTMWLKLDSIQYSFSQLLSAWDSDVGFSFGFSFQGYRKNTNLTFYWKNVPYQLTSAHNLPIGEWVHVGIVIDSVNATLYMNGEPWVYKFPDQARVRKFDLSKSAMVLGGGLPGQGGNFQGQMEELKIYNRALSEDEVKRGLHLIHPQGEVGLVAYYQFNENTTLSQAIYNRVGGRHLVNSGGKLIVSSAPIAVGISERRTLSAGTTKFDSTRITITTTESASRDVVVSKLFAKPFQEPAVAERLADDHYIIHSWKNKNRFDASSVDFSWIGKLSIDDANTPSVFSLFRRPVNSDQRQWTLSTTATSADTTARRVSFSPDTNFVGQYIIGTKGSSPLEVEDTSAPRHESTPTLVVQPTPTFDEVTISANGSKPFAGDIEMTTLDGCRVFQRDLTQNEVANQRVVIDTSMLSSGVYFVRLGSVMVKVLR